MKKSVIATSVALVLGASTISAEESSGNEGNVENRVVVTANRVSQNLIDVMADVEVIERADIERMQPQSFVDLLQSVAGVDVIKRGGHGQNSSVFTRGTNSNQTLILIDGVRVGSATLGEKAISSIAVTQIERIEIVKGPRAAIWGSDAISGVIQIFTRRLEAGEYQARLTVGDNGSHTSEVSVGFGTDSFTNTFTYGLKEFDGIDARLNYDDDEDGHDIESLALRGDYQLTDSSAIDWVVQKDQSMVEFDTGFGGDITRTENEILNIRYQFDQDDWHFSASYKESSDNAVTFGNGIGRDAAGIFETERQQFNLKVRNNLNDNWGVTFGSDWYEDDIAGTTTGYAEEQRETTSYFLAADYNSDTYLLDFAVRQDDVENVSNETTFNLAAGYRLAEGQVVSLNFGEGFKAPSFNDLYFPWGGNPDLQFETSENIELIYKGSFDSLFYTVSIFDSTIDNLIQWTPDANGVWSPGNVGKAEISGLNFTATIRDDELTHKFTASFVDAKDGANDEQLIRRAKKKMTYDLIASHGAFETFVQAQYVGDRPDSDYQTFESIQLTNYFQINVGVGYEFDSNWKVNLKINDLTREEPVQVSGYRPLEQEIYFSVTYQNLN